VTVRIRKKVRGKKNRVVQVDAMIAKGGQSENLNLFAIAKYIKQTFKIMKPALDSIFRCRFFIFQIKFKIWSIHLDCQMKCSINLTGFERFDQGTRCKLSPLCGLVRGNPQRPGIFDLSS
jgi:hypothetical protein